MERGRGRGNACQMESWSGRPSSDEAEKDRKCLFCHTQEWDVVLGYPGQTHQLISVVGGA